MKILLSDGQIDCPSTIFEKCRILPKLIEDLTDVDSVPLQTLSVRVFSKIIHFGQTGIIPDAPVDTWCVNDEQFDELKEVARAADYLDYPELFDATCKLIAQCLQGKTTFEINKIINGRDYPE